MKTFFSEMVEAEKFLRGELDPEDAVVFQAKLLVHEELRMNTFFHRMVHRLVMLHHRKQLKKEVEVVHERLFNDPEKTRFREFITNIFNT